MPLRSTGFSSPAASASLADFRSDVAIGSFVNVRFLNDAVTSSGAIGLPVALSMPWPTSCSLLRVALDQVIGCNLPLEEPLHDIGVVLEELRSDDQLCRHVLALGPQLALVDEDLAPALLDKPRRPWLGDPRAVDLA